jgi:hypothetical protein
MGMGLSVALMPQSLSLSVFCIVVHDMTIIRRVGREKINFYRCSSRPTPRSPRRSTTQMWSPPLKIKVGLEEGGLKSSGIIIRIKFSVFSPRL